MMFIKNSMVSVGDKVVLLQDITNCAGTFTIGTKMKVIGTGDRGFSLVDSEGNKVIEVPMSGNFKII